MRTAASKASQSQAKTSTEFEWVDVRTQRTQRKPMVAWCVRWAEFTWWPRRDSPCDAEIVCRGPEEREHDEEGEQVPDHSTIYSCYDQVRWLTMYDI